MGLSGSSAFSSVRRAGAVVRGLQRARGHAPGPRAGLVA